MSAEKAHEALRDQGREVMKEILGTQYVAKRDATTNEFNGTVRRLTEEFAYASLWTRGTLDRRTRSLATLAMLGALTRPHEMRIHLAGAINNGCTREEIGELFAHAIAYCGFPAANDALRLAEAVLGEMKEG
jgi:4-carboxymuconolactone decarboxylase